MKHIHLICNAHIDPVYLWDWEEGIIEALSTFRIAADFCEAHDGFVFNHNESLLYEWVLEFDPGLFTRIQSLVEAGKWHIMGGWYIQPDCNMPSGETMVRIIAEGRDFFSSHFNVRPSTAINFDPFGHSRGLVQILKGTGYDSYLFCRPHEDFLSLPSDDLIWEGYDGSQITCHRAFDLYKSVRGKAVGRIEDYISRTADTDEGLLLWGIGNHGGGPSKEDLEAIEAATPQFAGKGITLSHSTPEAFMGREQQELPVWESDFNPWGPGCYTTQIRIKQQFRRLENMLYSTEIMAAHAAMNGMAYPHEELQEIGKDLLFSSFHDILPGSQVPTAEESSLRRISHGLEIASRLRVRSFIQMTRGYPQPPEGCYPLFLYNPHPWEMSTTLQTELQLADRNRSDSWTVFEIVDEQGNAIPCQLEREESNIPIDWRKKISIQVSLPPAQMTRLICRPVQMDNRPTPNDSGRLIETDDSITVAADSYRCTISKETGSLSVQQYHKLILQDSCIPKVMVDSFDPWGVFVDRFDELDDCFSLKECPRVIESGVVRTIIEASFSFRESMILMRYIVNHLNDSVDLELDVDWHETDRMLKLPIETTLKRPRCLGQTLFGRETYSVPGRENISQKWEGLFSEDHAVAIINTGTYGFDYRDNELNISLLRSPAYCAYPVPGKQVIPEDRDIPRIDQGRRSLSFKIIFGDADELLKKIERKAYELNESPYILSSYTAGTGEYSTEPMVMIDDESITMSSCRMDEEGNLLVRFHEPVGNHTEATIRIPHLRIEKRISFDPFEIKSILVDANGMREVNLLGE